MPRGGEADRRVRVVTALRVEARPLIEAFGLEREAVPRGAPIGELWGNEQLVVACSGVGRVAAAACVGWLHATLGNPQDAPWLNVGIAGADHWQGGLRAEVGEAMLAGCVHDRATERASQASAQRARELGLAQPPRLKTTWYPPQLVRGDLRVDRVHSVDAVELAFDKSGAFEMEASGFYGAAVRCSTAELVQVFKVVSDTPRERVQQLDAARIGELVAAHAVTVAGLVQRLRALGREIDSIDEEDAPAFVAWTARGRWTLTQRRQLRALLQRWRALSGQAVDESSPVAPDELGDDTRRRLLWLDSEVARRAPKLGAPWRGDASEEALDGRRGGRE